MFIKHTKLIRVVIYNYLQLVSFVVSALVEGVGHIVFIFKVSATFPGRKICRRLHDE